MKRQILLVLLILFGSLSGPVQAGMPGPLCEAVNESKYIVEVTIDTTVAKYPESYAQKKWAPNTEELLKVAKTAKITAVHKGSKKVGDFLNNDDLISATWGSHSDGFWTNFFAQKQTTILTGPNLDGWVADSGNAPLAFEKDYTEFRTEVLNCLKP